MCVYDESPADVSAPPGGGLLRVGELACEAPLL